MKYIDILSVTLVILISIVISCNGKSQETISNEKNLIDSSYLKDCPIFQCDQTIDSMNIKLDAIQKRLKDE